MRDFRKYDVWNISMSLVKDVYSLIKEFPADEKFGLSSQIKRAAISIPSNIAEGCSRSSELEFKRFIEIAIGSSFELETQLILAKNLGFLKEEQLNTLLTDLNEIQARLNSLRNKLKAKSK